MSLNSLNLTTTNAKLVFLIFEPNLVTIVDILSSCCTLFLISVKVTRLPVTLSLHINDPLWIDKSQNYLEKDTKILNIDSLILFSSKYLPEVVKDLSFRCFRICIRHFGQETKLNQYVLVPKIVKRCPMNFWFLCLISAFSNKLFLFRRRSLLFQGALMLLLYRWEGLPLLNRMKLDHLVPNQVKLFVELLNQVLVRWLDLVCQVHFLVLLLYLLLNLSSFLHPLLPVFDQLLSVFADLRPEFRRRRPIFVYSCIIWCKLWFILTLVSLDSREARCGLLESWSHWLILIIVHQFLHLFFQPLLFKSFLSLL